MPRPVSSPSARPRRTLVVLATTLSLTVSPALARAGAAPTDSVAPTPAPTTARPAAPAGPTLAGPTLAGPTLAGAAVAARTPRSGHQATSADARAALQQQRRHHGPAVAMMIVGGAAVVLGVLVGGDAQAPLVVGGAVVGLIGLYQYLL